MATGDSQNPMEEFLRQFGIKPGPDGTFDINQLMGPLQQAFTQMSGHLSPSGDGDGLNWTLVRDVARKVTASSGPDPSPSATQESANRDAVALADLWLDDHLAMGRVDTSASAWSRAEWVEQTISTWEQLAGSVSSSLAAAVGGLLETSDQSQAAGMAAMMEPMMRVAAAGMLAAHVGKGIGRLATDVLSTSDLGFPLTSRPVVALLPTNVSAFSDGLDIPLADVRLYVALRETARQRLFAQVSWLGPQMLALIEHYARDLKLDAGAFEEAIEAHLSGGLTPERIEEFGNQLAGKLFQPAVTKEQTEILGRLETLVALVEGWVDDVVSQSCASYLPRASALLEIVRRRRASASISDAALKTLLNLELRPRRIRDAANLWAAVRARRGVAERDDVWSHPDMVPTGADLDDPLSFAENGHVAAAPDDLDTMLAQLLDEERGKDGTRDAGTDS